MVGQDWYEAKAAWTWEQPEWPYKRDIPRPAKQSVQSEMEEWKLRAIYGNNVPREQEKRPIGGHG